jgi:hypothetical protein
MDILKTFVNNKPVKQAVHDYLINTLKEDILNKAFSGQNITGYAEAKSVIEKAFNKLEGEYGEKIKTTINPR